MPTPGTGSRAEQTLDIVQKALREETRDLSPYRQPLYSRRRVRGDTEAARLCRLPARMGGQGFRWHEAYPPERGRRQSDRPPRPARHGRKTAVPCQRRRDNLPHDSRAHDRGVLGEMRQGRDHGYSRVQWRGVHGKRLCHQASRMACRMQGCQKTEKEEPETETVLPDWKEGDTLAVKASSITEGRTKPKPLHTEATLLAAMETAGKNIEDEELRQALKDCGIGTPATRASIIETLFGP